MDIQENKEKIIKLLESTKKEGIKNLINYLEKNNYFESPAAIRYHSTFKGGLAYHSLSVYNLYKKMYEEIFKLDFEEIKNEIIIAALLHDLCKLGLYIKEGNKYITNKNHPKKHATLSIEIIKKFIVLTEFEEKLIKYHMGMYGVKELSRNTLPEYSIYQLAGTYCNKKIKLFYFCDDLSSQFMESGK